MFEQNNTSRSKDPAFDSHHVKALINIH